ncbi:type I polyketide synthase [Streptomyces sp. NPDC090029]|uniref:type I polyketide synthase n=1 Tax=Streptomyces sp. NPDC090029 TaxID=3365924 RepID=UPI003810901A
MSQVQEGYAIAVVGMGSRMPMAANTEAFWNNLLAGRDCVRREKDPRTGLLRAGGWVDDLEGFDSALFPMSAREAALLDPQHRMFLECCWSALESAGVVPGDSHAVMGLFGGVGISSYLVNNVLPGLSGAGERTFYDASADLQLLLAADKDYLTSRVAYRLNLRGPVITVQAACATGLVAVHLAAQSLLNGECDIALAGAASASVPQLNRHLHEPGMVLSEDGYCRSFDAGATGTVFGSGAAVLALKRLEDAVRDGDVISGVIRGSAVGNDGSGRAGMTAPSSRGQAAVVAEALTVAEIDPSDIDYVEAHGTATPVGDPIEVTALNAVFGDVRDRTIGLGSVKTNIGHIGTAAGMAGLVKTLLCLRHGTHVPSLHFDRSHPDIPFDQGPFEVVTERKPWLARPYGGARRAGVSAFGVGGNNAHVIVEQHVPSAAGAPVRPAVRTSGWHLVPLSAASTTALAKGAAQLASVTDVPLPDLAATLARHRTHHGQRVGLVVGDQAELGRALASVAEGRRPPAQAEADPFMAMMFTGHSPGGAALGELGTAAPVQAVLAAADPVMRACTGLSATDVLLRGRGADHPLTVGQPAQLVLQAALYELWQSWGVRPRLVIGHSLGEYAAAYAAGVLELEDAVRLVAARGRLLSSLPDDGAMSALEAGRDEVIFLIERLDLRLSVAAINGPSSTVVSGPAVDVDVVAAHVAASGRRVKHLGFGRAGHSKSVEAVLDAFSAEVAGARLSVPQLTFVSNLTGGPVGDEVTDPQYWVRHLRESVQFASGMAHVLQQRPTALLEVGPAPVLSGMVASGWPDCTIPILPTLRPATNPERTALTSLAALYEAGVDVDWATVSPGYPSRRAELPTYVFDRKRHWFDAPEGKDAPVPVPAGSVAQTIQDSYYYRTAWEPNASDTHQRLLRGHWLILPDAAGVANSVADELRALGHLCTQVDPAPDAGGLPTVCGTALREFMEAPPLPISGVLSFQALDFFVDASDRGLDGDAVSGAAERVVLGALEVLQVVTATTTTPLRTWLFTRGAATIGNHPVDPLHATVAAAARCAVHEFPALSCTRVDLDPVTSLTHVASDVADVLNAFARHGEADVAYRQGNRYVRRIQRAPLPEPRLAGTPASDGTYLVTGGLGGLGPVVARSLLLEGAGHVVLVGRTNDGQDRRDRTRREIGAVPGLEDRLSFAYADVTDASAVSALVQELDRPGRRLRGVVHAAAQLSDAALHNQDAAGFRAAWRAKALGAWNLHLALENCSALDFFTCFTSATGVLGNPGQLNYAAANAFVDALMEHRCQRQLPGQSLAWGPWSEVGRLSDDVLNMASLRRSGMGALSRADGEEALRALLGRNSGAGAVLANSWPTWQRNVGPAERRSIEHLATGSDSAHERAEAQSLGAELGKLLHTGDLAAVRARVLGRVTSLVTDVLGAEPEPQARLRDLGIDSLSAVQLRNALARDLDVPLPMNACMSRDSSAELADYLTELLSTEHSVRMPAATPV